MSMHRYRMAHNFQGGWNEAIYARQAAAGNALYVYASEFVFEGIANVDARAYVWLVKTATTCQIRLSEYHTDSGLGINWYDTTGTGQGDPGNYSSTYAVAFDLNAIPDTVNIYTSNSTTVLGTPSFPQIGSWTDDNKSTFFNPTQDVKYGRYVSCNAQAGPGFDNDTEQGYSTLQFTFRKAGYTDYTISFKYEARAYATSEI